MQARLTPPILPPPVAIILMYMFVSRLLYVTVCCGVMCMSTCVQIFGTQLVKSVSIVCILLIIIVLMLVYWYKYIHTPIYISCMIDAIITVSIDDIHIGLGFDWIDWLPSLLQRLPFYFHLLLGL